MVGRAGLGLAQKVESTTQTPSPANSPVCHTILHKPSLRASVSSSRKTATVRMISKIKREKEKGSQKLQQAEEREGSQRRGRISGGRSGAAQAASLPGSLQPVGQSLSLP